MSSPKNAVTVAFIAVLALVTFTPANAATHALTASQVAAVSHLSAVSKAITPTQVFANNCGIPSYKPTSLTQFCADAGTEVAKIHWNSWSATSASGTGILAINSCDPYCAAGKIYQSKVNIRLTHLVKTHGREYLLNVSVSLPKGGKFNLPPKMQSIPGGLSWVSNVWTTR